MSVKDNPNSRNLKILMFRTPYATRQYRVTMNGQLWPKDGRPVSLSKVFAALRKAVVKATA